MKDNLRLLWRGGWLVAHILAAFPLAIIFLPKRSREHSAFQKRLFSWWMKSLCRIMNVHLAVHGTAAAEPTLIVANHVSWLDIPVLASVWQGRFLSKADVAEWPVIGWLLRRTGTLLIRRGAQRASGKAVSDISRTLWTDESVCIFPEGTTTGGAGVRRFHPRLFQAACRTGVRVQPVMLRYPAAAGLSDSVPFTGDDEFMPHLLRLLRQPRLDVELIFLPCLQAAEHRPDELAAFSQAMVGWALDPSPSGRQLDLLPEVDASDAHHATRAYRSRFAGHLSARLEPAHGEGQMLN